MWNIYYLITVKDLWSHCSNCFRVFEGGAGRFAMLESTQQVERRDSVVVEA